MFHDFTHNCPQQKMDFFHNLKTFSFLVCGEENKPSDVLRELRLPR